MTDIKKLELGRVPGNYPVPARYCTTRHYPDSAGYYFKISRFLRLSTICNVVKCKVGICLATSLMHDTVASHVTDNCPLVALRGRGDGNRPRDGLISQLTRHIAMYVLTSETITQCDSRLRCFSGSVYCPLASVCVYTTGSHYIIQ